jgi:hypothetical protein
MSREHGYARYRLDGCRCYVCGYARMEYDDRRNRLIAYGRWQPFVPLEETQLRILSLRELGYGDRSIARLAGLNRKAVRDIRTGTRHDPGRGNPPLTKIRATTAAAIAAIPYNHEAAPDGAYIDATTTWRRLDVLIRLGWTRTRLATALGSTATAPALQLGHDRVTARNARKVRDLYDKVTQPPARMVTPAAAILRDLEHIGEPG